MYEPLGTFTNRENPSLVLKNVLTAIPSAALRHEKYALRNPTSWERPVLQVELLPSKRAGEVKVNMRSFTPRIIENGIRNTMDRDDKKSSNKFLDTKPSIQSYHLKMKRIGPGYSMNDLDKLVLKKKLPNLSMESLKSILKNSNVSYLDSGDICKHDIGGSAPDFKKIFVTEYIWASMILLQMNDARHVKCSYERRNHRVQLFVLMIIKATYIRRYFAFNSFCKF